MPVAERKITPCSKCGGEIEEARKGKYSYCRKCNTEYNRAHRKKHSELDPYQRLRANTRAYSKEYFKRGKIPKLPCAVCGCENTNMHHPDYNKPLWIVWLCEPCHIKMHKEILSKMHELANAHILKGGVKEYFTVVREIIDRED